LDWSASVFCFIRKTDKEEVPLKSFGVSFRNVKGGGKTKGGDRQYMNKVQKIAASVIAGGALLMNGFLPVLANTTIEISGNGAGSNNAAVVTSVNQTSVTQSNTAVVNNDLDSSAKTGGNDANFNTGGDVTVDTGDATVSSNVSTAVNSNAAEVGCCGAGSADVLIQGNGANSNNQVTPTLSNTVSVNQTNRANINNEVEGSAETGHNDANSNTGGDVTVRTGNATVDTTISNKANANSAMVGGGSALITPSVSFRILDNGAGSNNYITAGLANSTAINQGNAAAINNDIDSSAKTGENDAKYNTGGDVTIDTGWAKVLNDVDNMANFNYASADCGCLYDVLAKIDGNGAFNGEQKDDPNTIVLTLVNSRTFGQTNAASLNNEMDDLYAKTGYNDANLNTGTPDFPSDPSVLTGNATVDNTVSNSANMNVIGGELPLPAEWPFGGVSVSFDWAAFWAYFGLHIS
jgi:hypothetical protein